MALGIELERFFHMLMDDGNQQREEDAHHDGEVFKTLLAGRELLYCFVFFCLYGTCTLNGFCINRAPVGIVNYERCLGKILVRRV